MKKLLLLLLVALPSPAICQTLDDYEAWKARQQQSSVGAATVDFRSVQQGTDQLAGDLSVENERGQGGADHSVPPALFTREFFPDLLKKIEEERAETPLPTTFMRNMENPGVARDDQGAALWSLAALALATIAGIVGLWRARRAIMRTISGAVVAFGAGTIIAARKIARTGISLRSAMIERADKHDGNG